MQDDTFKSLLVRIRDVDDEESWVTFVEIYEPFIEGYLRRRGISGELTLDVRHVVQGLLVRLEPHFRENTLLAFRKTTLEQMTAADVAAELGMTRNAVIVARSKVLRKLRELAGEFLD